jgi:hypothetical protein
MGLPERESRRARRKARRQHLIARVKHAARPLDDDDREALTQLVKRGAEILGDGVVSPPEIEELKELVGELAEARANTPAKEGEV